MITPLRYIRAFAMAVIAGSVASALMLAMLSGNPGKTLGDLLAGLFAATAVSGPVVFVVGLVAVALERLLLRRKSDPQFMLAVVVCSIAAALLVEWLLFSGQYSHFGQLLPSALAAGLAAALVWRQMIRRKESRINA